MIEKCDLVTLHFEADFDASTAQSKYKQKNFVDSPRDLKKEESLFLTWLATSDYNLCWRNSNCYLAKSVVLLINRLVKRVQLFIININIQV